MRFELEFILKDEYFPRDYHKTVISFIKKSLQEYESGKHFNKYYNSQLSENNMKKFSWSVNLISPKFEKNHIKVEGKKIIVTFVDPDRLSSFIMFSAFSKQTGKPFKVSKDNEMTLEKVAVGRNREVTGNIVHFKTYSPIALRMHCRESNKDKYITVEDEGFISELKNSLQKEFPEFSSEIKRIKVDLSGMKKQVVPLFGQMIDVSIGDFLVEGDKNLLKKLYENSIGSRKSAGFGVLNVEYSWELI